MSVLQPLLLAALPLAALPIIIHLINQRRFQTVRWGAMMFLLAANRMSRGYARLRQWLILAFRVLAVAGLIVALSRPLASGWLGLTAGGKADTTIIVLDRSLSMSQQEPGTSRSKLKAGVEQLVSALNLLGSGRWVLIENSARAPRELEKPGDLLTLPEADPTSAASDLPAMLAAARDYIKTNKTGRTEIWLCSDLRENDWNEQGGKWSSLRDGFLEFPQAIRFHLLAYADPSDGNLTVRVTGARRQRTATGSELLLSVLLTREGGDESTRTVPLRIELDGASSEVTIEMTGPRFEWKDHPVPLDANQQRGWGRIAIPTDTNPADNEAYFVYDEPPVRQTIIVTDDPAAVKPLQVAAAVSPDSTTTTQVEVLGEDQLATVDWEKVALVLWQAPLPTGAAEQSLNDLVARGGQVIFFPPKAPGSSAMFGMRWKDWADAEAETSVETWRGDQDLLAHTQDGTALPVGELQVRRTCGIDGESTALATLRGGQPLLARVPTDRGGVYFCATTAASRDSTLASNGVVLYVLLQRALAVGAKVLGDTRDFAAGETAIGDTAEWQRIAGPTDSLSTDYAVQRGVYSSGPLLIAVNRPTAEDGARVLDADEIKALFQGLDFTRVDDKANRLAALVQEIWRAFLLTMMIALVAESALCLPKIVPRAATAAGATT